ncbi:MAG: GPW/gp25 family protein [Rhizobiales bacterium]|nr:GPW/gp25 family protein [Hyphomicrobiales bacterium]
MQGVCQHTGQKLVGEAHIRQSIERILFTPLTSIVMRPEFGSDLIDLISAPSNDNTRIRVFVATAKALAIWEKRIELKRLDLQFSSLGVAILSLNYTNLETGQDVQQSISSGGLS